MLKRSVLLAAAALLAVGCASHASGLRAQPHVTVTVTTTTTATATHTVIRYRKRHHPHPSPAPAAPSVSFGCKVLQDGAGSEEFNVTTLGGATYDGTIYVSFYGPTGSGETFPGTSVQGSSPAGHWYPVPAADIGASAEPVGCVASA